MGIRVPSTMTWSPSPRPVRASWRPGAQPARTSSVSSTYRQAVAWDIPKPDPSCENVSFFRRWTSVSSACWKQPSLRQRVLRARRCSCSSQATCSTSSCGTSSVAGYGTNRAPSVAGVLSGITTPTTRGPASSPHPLTSPFHPPAQDERGSLTAGDEQDELGREPEEDPEGRGSRRGAWAALGPGHALRPEPCAAGSSRPVRPTSSTLPSLSSRTRPTTMHSAWGINSCPTPTPPRGRSSTGCPRSHGRPTTGGGGAWRAPSTTWPPTWFEANGPSTQPPGMPVASFGSGWQERGHPLSQVVRNKISMHPDTLPTKIVEHKTRSSTHSDHSETISWLRTARPWSTPRRR